MTRLIRKALTRVANASHVFRKHRFRWRGETIETFDGRYRLFWADGRVHFLSLEDER